jgi:acyl dehydratase
MPTQTLEGEHLLEPVSAENRRPVEERAENGDIHDDSVAAEYGFQGAVVHGIRVLEAALAPAYREWGTGWFDGGRVALRHRRPVYHGARLVARYRAADDGGYALTVLDPAGEEVAVGELHPPTGPASPLAPPPAVPVANPKRLAEKGSIAVGDVVSGEPVTIDDTLLHLHLYDDESLRRPGIPLLASSVLVHIAGAAGFDTYDWVTPGMYYAADATFLAPPRFGATVRSSGPVVETFERNGNDYFVVDYTVADDDRVLALVRQTVMYHMAPRGSR